jgi:hypothetical protein
MNKLGFNFFDLLLGAGLVVGLLYGRKRGMSRVWVGLLKWLLILFVGAVVYQPLGGLLAKSGLLGPTASCLIVYLGVAVLILFLFAGPERRVRAEGTENDYFGRAEYYFGMISGAVQACCMVLVTLAVLNARSFTPAEVKAKEAYQFAAYGSHVFPTLYDMQVEVFERSLTGPWIKQDLGFLLINPRDPDDDKPAK